MFRMVKYTFYLVCIWLLFGCVQPSGVSRDSGRTLGPILEPATQPATRDWGQAQLILRVPESLSVSESESIRPSSDIVWREDPLGDRRAQVQALMVDALAPVVFGLEGRTPVRIEIEVTRFHALTDRARYTIGGEHEISFILSVRHGTNDALLQAPRMVELRFEALGGRQAIEAEALGITQRVRISDHLQDWARGAFGA